MGAFVFAKRLIGGLCSTTVVAWALFFWGTVAYVVYDMICFYAVRG